MSEFSFTEVYLRHVFESLSKYSVNLGIFCSGFATFTSRFAVSWGRGRENGEGLVARGQREGSHGTRNGNEKTKNLHIHCKKKSNPQTTYLPKKLQIRYDYDF